MSYYPEIASGDINTSLRQKNEKGELLG